jgi:hypothetical protein
MARPWARNVKVMASAVSNEPMVPVCSNTARRIDAIRKPKTVLVKTPAKVAPR